MLRVCRADSSTEMAHLCEVTTCGTRSLVKWESNASWTSRRDTARTTMPRTMMRTAENATPNLAPIFKLPRNIVLLLRPRSVGVTPGHRCARQLARLPNVLVQHAASVTRRSLTERLGDNGCTLHASSRAARLH